MRFFPVYLHHHPYRIAALLSAAALLLRFGISLLIFPDLEGIYDSYKRIIISQNVQDWIIANPLSREGWREMWIWLPFPFLLNALVGFAAGDVVTAAKVTNLLVSSASAGVIYLLVKMEWSERAAVIAGLFIVFSPVHLLYSYSGLSEGLFSFLILCSLYCFNLAERRDGYLLLSAVLLSLATLTRYEGWWMIPLFIWGAFFYHRRTPFAVIASVVISLTGIIFWGAVNYHVYEDPLWFRSALAAYLSRVAAYNPAQSTHGFLNILHGLWAYLAPSLPVIPFAVIGFSMIIKKNLRSRFVLSATILSGGLFLFLLASLVSNNSLWYYRYGIPPAVLLPILAAAGCEKAAAEKRKAGIIVSAAGFSGAVVWLACLLSFKASANQWEASAYLKKEYAEGRLTGRIISESPLVQIESGIPDQIFFDADAKKIIPAMKSEKVECLVILAGDHSMLKVIDSLIERGELSDWQVAYDSPSNYYPKPASTPRRLIIGDPSISPKRYLAVLRKIR